jgi:hypothetical protein
MITRVMIELNIERDTYEGDDELESLVIDELSELMRSDILAGARVDLVDTIGGTMAVITNA